jgi:hypothetical protein
MDLFGEALEVFDQIKREGEDKGNLSMRTLGEGIN